MATTTRLPSPWISGSWPPEKISSTRKTGTPICDTMLVYMQVEYRLRTTYLGVLIRLCVSVHVQIFVRSTSDKGV